jgi:hypothetical protein
MSFKIVVIPSAKADIKSAEKWYETQQEGLGKKFKLQIVKAIDSIAEPVRGNGPVYVSLSRAFIEKFPYCSTFEKMN